MTKTANDDFDFSKKMQELEKLVEILENDANIDKAISSFEKASQLTKELQEYLHSAENKITTIKQRFDK